MDYNYERVVLNIRHELKKYVIDNGLKSLVIGVSGGVDSAVCSALAQPVCDELNIPLIGRSITIESNKQDEIDRAQKVGDLFCMDFKEVNLTEDYDIIKSSFNSHEGTIENDTTADKIRLGNIKARLRSIYLYNIAQINKGLVLSTDNLSESLLGFFTIHGDHFDFGMLQNLFKTEVYDLSRYLADRELTDTKAYAVMECVDAIPTDGLGITESDLDQIGAASYAEVDNILQSYLLIDAYMGTDDMTEELRVEHKKLLTTPVVKRHINSQFKRNWPINIPRRVAMKGVE